MFLDKIMDHFPDASPAWSPHLLLPQWSYKWVARTHNLPSWVLSPTTATKLFSTLGCKMLWILPGRSTCPLWAAPRASPKKGGVTVPPGNWPGSQLMVTWLVRALAFFMSAKDAVSWWLSHKESTCQYMRRKRCGFNPLVRKIPWSRKWHPAPVFVPKKFHGQRSLASMGSQRIGHNWATELKAHKDAVSRVTPTWDLSLRFWAF